MTLPDGQERLAWHRVLVFDVGSETSPGTADIIYVDAQNGNPLVYVTDASVGTPNLTCSRDSDVIMEAIINKLIRTLWSKYGIIGMIMVMSALLWRGRKFIYAIIRHMRLNMREQSIL